LLRADGALLTARQTIVEVRRNLARLLSGRDLSAARAAFAEDLRSLSIIELDEVTCESAATIAERLACERSMPSILRPRNESPRPGWAS
jgi:hypothetical protein